MDQDYSEIFGQSAEQDTPVKEQAAEAAEPSVPEEAPEVSFGPMGQN